MEEKIVMTIATLLDPRFKKITFCDARAIDKMTQRIVSDVKALYQETQQQQNEHTPSATVHNDPPTPHSQAAILFGRYLISKLQSLLQDGFPLSQLSLRLNNISNFQ